MVLAICHRALSPMYGCLDSMPTLHGPRRCPPWPDGVDPKHPLRRNHRTLHHHCITVTVSGHERLHPDVNYLPQKLHRQLASCAGSPLWDPMRPFGGPRKPMCISRKSCPELRTCIIPSMAPALSAACGLNVSLHAGHPTGPHGHDELLANGERAFEGQNPRRLRGKITLEWRGCSRENTLGKYILNRGQNTSNGGNHISNCHTLL